MSLTNAQRQRRYIVRLKARAKAPHSPDLILQALAKLKPAHAKRIPVFTKQLITEAERLQQGRPT